MCFFKKKNFIFFKVGLAKLQIKAVDSLLQSVCSSFCCVCFSNIFLFLYFFLFLSREGFVQMATLQIIAVDSVLHQSGWSKELLRAFTFKVKRIKLFADVSHKLLLCQFLTPTVQYHV